LSFINAISPKRIYIIAVSTLIVLIVSNQLLIQKILEEKKDDATIINLAGRQRMLSQKIAKNVFLSIEKEVDVEELKEDVKSLVLAHEGLQNGNESLGISPNEDEFISSLFIEIEPHFKGIRASLANIESREDIEKAIPALQEHEGEFLSKMDEIVTAFEMRSTEAVNNLIWVEVALGLFSLLVLGGEIYLVFKVFLSQLESKNEELGKNLEELSDSKGALFESTQRFDLSLQAIDAGIWDWFLEDNSEWWSPRFYEMLGYEDSEIKASYNTFLNSLLHPEDKKKVVAAVENHLKNKEPYKLEIQMKKKSGEYSWFETVGRASWDSEGNPIRMVGSIIDINERVSAANDLEFNKIRLEEAQSIAKIGNWNWDMDMDELTWSDQNYEVFSQDKSFNPNFDDLQELIHPDDKEPFNKDVEKAIAEKVPHDFIHRIILNEGNEIRYIHERGKVFYDDDDKPIRMAGTSQDVTETIQREKELEIKAAEIQKGLNLLSETQNAAKIGSWEVNLKTSVPYWSDEVYRIHELPIGTEIDLEEAINFYREDFREVVQNAINTSIETAGSWDEECVLVTAKGNELWVRAIGHPAFEKGELVGLRGLFMDIDESKRKTLELDETNEKLQLSVEAGQIAIWIWDLKTSELDWNDKAYEVFGVDKSIEPTFELFGEMVHPDDFDYMVKSTQETVETGNRFDIQFRLNRPDGNEIVLNGRGDVVYNNEGEAVQLIGINMDITERMKLMEGIKLQESQLRSFVEQAPAAVAMFDNEMRYITVSNRWYEHNRIEGENIIGVSHYDVLPQIKARKDWVEIHQRVFEGEEITNPKDRFVRKDGTQIWVNWTVIPWHNSEGEIGGLIMYVSDITKEVEYTEQLEKEIKERTQKVREQAESLEVANKELESFSYSISHDLRAPLRSINGFSDILMEDHADQLDEEGRRLMGVVKESAVTMGQLIDDMLNFSRLGKKKLLKSDVDMRALFESVFNEESAHYDRERIEANIEKLPSAKGDIALLKQVVVNLISNAFKYSSKEEKIIINISAEALEDKIVYSIEDNGVGFNMDYHDKLFGVFQRLHSKKEFEGTGVGLAIVKRIINKHGGQIWAESIEGQGTKFFFSLPIKK